MASHRHHYVPQFYLRNFADPKRGGEVWLYPKGGGKPFPKYPKAFAFAWDYHTVTRADGSRDSDTLESMFTALENQAALVIRKILADETLSASEHETFVAFVGAMLARVPRQSDYVGTVMSTIAKQILQMQAFHKESFHADFQRFQEETGKLGIGDPEAVRQAYLSDELALKTNPEVALSMSVSSVATIVNCLLRMNWIFVRREGRFRFLTCDAPVFCVDPTLPANVWYGSGLRAKGMEVSLPLSPEVAAIGSYHPKGKARRNITPKLVRRLNQMRIYAAHVYVFADEGSDALQRFVSHNNDSTQPVRDR